jgi:hypothetical protein
MRRRAVTLAAAAAVLLVATAARAEPRVVSKKMWFGERRGKLAVTTSFTELLDERAYGRLGSGFATNIVARIYVYQKDRELPVSFAMASLRLVYDLWDEVYVVRTDGPAGRQTRRYDSRAEALRALTELRQLPIADLSDIPRGKHHYMAMVVELNPVSKELMAEMRRWLTRPAGTTSIDRSSSFFGSFVSVFVNPRMPEADRVLWFRSQPFYRPVK